MNAEEQIRRIGEAVDSVAAALQPGPNEKFAEALYARGVRVLQLDETILSRSDANLLNLVRQAVERWEKKKREAKVRSDESERTFDVKPGVADAAREELILAALNGARKPLGRVPAIQAAAGWHQDYRPPSTEWEPWRAAWRNLLIQRRIQRTNNPSTGEESLWKATPVPAGGWHPVLVEFWQRRKEFPGLCVALVSMGRSTMYGYICGKKEDVTDSGACGVHAHEIRDIQ